ncbi:MAG TPA: hypothetical protein VKT33_08865 [Candidatus Angelobacter sp.]|nr:hypothetical protein [Candidatus Angelobacter sp.]
MSKKILAIWTIGISLIVTIAVAVPWLRARNAGHYPPAATRVLQVNSPASIRSSEISPNGPSPRDVIAGAGQYLLISTRDTKFASETVNPIVVQPPEAGSLPLKPLREGGSCSGTWLYQLPVSGTYRVTFAPQKGTSHEPNITVLDGKNAILEPGITAEQIAIDFRGFAEKSQMHLDPYEAFDACDIDDLQAPTHWVVQNSGFELRIMPLEGLKLLSAPYAPDDSIHNLEAALHQSQIVADDQKLPYPAFEGFGREMMARQELLTGKGWRGLRWIGGYTQDGFDPGAPDGDYAQDRDYPGLLGYVFEGISDDGRFFIMIRASIAHPQQEHDLVELKQASNNPEKETQLRLLLEKTLTAAAPDSFRPNLAELDAVVQSLEFRQ